MATEKDGVKQEGGSGDEEDEGLRIGEEVLTEKLASQRHRFIALF